jgi:hypothetical protein
LVHQPNHAAVAGCCLAVLVGMIQKQIKLGLIKRHPDALPNARFAALEVCETALYAFNWFDGVAHLNG